MQSFLTEFDEVDSYTIDSTHEDYEAIVKVASRAIQLLNISETDLYTEILDGIWNPTSVAVMANDVHEVYKELPIVNELEMLYQKLRLLKLEGKAYEVLDEFFNLHLAKTL